MGFGVVWGRYSKSGDQFMGSLPGVIMAHVDSVSSGSLSLSSPTSSSGLFDLLISRGLTPSLSVGIWLHG